MRSHGIGLTPLCAVSLHSFYRKSREPAKGSFSREDCDPERGELWTVIAVLVLSAGTGVAIAIAPEEVTLGRAIISLLQPAGEWLVGPEAQ